jgi:chromosome segregation ATPase
MSMFSRNAAKVVPAPTDLSKLADEAAAFAQRIINLEADRDEARQRAADQERRAVLAEDMLTRRTEEFNDRISEQKARIETLQKERDDAVAKQDRLTGAFETIGGQLLKIIEEQREIRPDNYRAKNAGDRAIARALGMNQTDTRPVPEFLTKKEAEPE